MVVRSAVVGAGVISETHLDGAQKNPRTELVGVCDLDERAAIRRAREFGCVPVTDLSELLDLDVDCLHVCTPVQTHFDIARQAIEAGVAVIVEKPATVTAEEVETLAALADEHDVPATVVHNHLFEPVTGRVREAIDAGELGELVGVEVISTGLTAPDEVHRGSWVFDLPGGEFEEGLPHPIYTALGLGGFPASRDDVSAQTVRTGEYDGEFAYDQAQVQYVSERGALCSVTMLSNTLPQRLLVVNGSERSLLVDRINQSVTTVDGDYTASALERSRKGLDASLAQLASTTRNASMVLRSAVDDSWEQSIRRNSHFAIFDAFVDAIESGSDVPVPLEQSAWTIRIMDLIREAARAHSAEDAVDSAPEIEPTIER